MLLYLNELGKKQKYAILPAPIEISQKKIQDHVQSSTDNDDDDGDRTVHAGLLIMVRREQRFNFMAFTHFSCSSCLILLQPIQSYTRAAFVALELIFMKVHLALA